MFIVKFLEKVRNSYICRNLLRCVLRVFFFFFRVNVVIIIFMKLIFFDFEFYISRILYGIVFLILDFIITF